MSISGAWKAGQPQAGALKWGTGVHPIHGVRMDRHGRVLPAHTGQGGQGAPPLEIQDVLLEQEIETVDYADSATYGYNIADGTALRPHYDELPEEYRGKNQYIPARGDGGLRFRPAAISGAEKRRKSKTSEREETVSEGWENKEIGDVATSETSDPRQYEMQTSMAQRDLIRAGSQISGTASEHNAPIPSQRPTWGQRIKPWSGGRRHYDMTPKRQDDYLRPFLYRNAGTGNTEWMGHNEATNYMVTPLDRQPVPAPYSRETPSAPIPHSDFDANDWVDSWY